MWQAADIGGFEVLPPPDSLTAAHNQSLMGIDIEITTCLVLRR